MEIILVFATGRSGTAFLAQYFGGPYRNKFEWKIRGNTAIAHEPFDRYQEYWQAVSSVKQGEKTEMIDFFMEKLSKLKDCSTFFITDNKLARWFWQDFKKAGMSVKFIYILRDEEKTVKSLKRKSHLDRVGWGYQPTDMHSLTDRSLDPFWYHVKETSAQWSELKKRFNPEQYTEVSFERFFTDRDERKKVEDFVGLSGYEYLLKKKVNISLPFPFSFLKKVLPEPVKLFFKRFLNIGYVKQ